MLSTTVSIISEPWPPFDLTTCVLPPQSCPTTKMSRKSQKKNPPLYPNVCRLSQWSSRTKTWMIIFFLPLPIRSIYKVRVQWRLWNCRRIWPATAIIKASSGLFWFVFLPVPMLVFECILRFTIIFFLPMFNHIFIGRPIPGIHHMCPVFCGVHRQFFPSFHN